MDIRDRIDALLTEKGWGRKTLSRNAGLSEDFVRKFMEKPDQQMGHENLIKIADALGVTTEFLLHGAAADEDPETDKVVSIFSAIPRKDRGFAIEVLRRFAKETDQGA